MLEYPVDKTDMMLLNRKMPASEILEEWLATDLK
jgi:hypothetical protein